MDSTLALTSSQRLALVRDGYLLVPSLLDSGVVESMRRRLDKLAEDTVDRWDADPDMKVEEGGVVNADLDPHDPDFAVMQSHPLVAAAATEVLGPAWHLRELGMRAPIPGCGAQGLHTDFGTPRVGSVPWRSLSAMWCVSEFTADNGPLRVIPGSHLVDWQPYEELAFGSGMGPHPDEVKVLAPAGSLILFNSPDLWHSGTFNYSPHARLAVTAQIDPD